MAGPNILNFASKVVFLNGLPLTLPIAASDPGSAIAGDLYYNSVSNLIRYYNGTIWSSVGSGSGTVTSIALADSTGIFNITGSPVTTSGTLTLASLQSQAANTFLAAPNGSSGAPTFRLIVAADVPTLNQNTTGTAANTTATSNSTITTLSALSLPYSQLTGTPSLSGFANTTLSNLGTTAINADLIPAADITYNLGSPSVSWSSAYISSVNSNGVNIRFSGTTVGSLSNATTLPSGVTADLSLQSAQGKLVGISTPSNATANSTATSNVRLETGNKTAGTGNSGDIIFQTGTSSGGIRGVISLNGSAINANSTQIHNVVDPTSAQDAATKNYVDTHTTSSTLTQNHILVGNASNVATDVAMSGEASIVASGAVTLSNAAVIAKVLTGYVSGAGTITSADSILTAIEKLNGNAGLYLPLTGGTMSGNIAMGGNNITGLSDGTFSGSVLNTGMLDVANGIATLDGSGKVPYSQLPSALMTYKGAWNPTDVVNTLTALDASPINGDVFRASADGIAVAGNGAVTGTQFYAGDFAIYNGTAWQRSPLADGVISVNGSTGAVTVNAINQLTGDVTAGPASGSQSQVATLATVNSNVGSFGSSTSIPSFTVNAKGLITAASGNAVVAPAGTLSGTTLNATVVSSSLTSVGTIATGVWNGSAVGPLYGGTGLSSYATGDTLYASATNVLSKLSIGSAGQVLEVVSGIPAWTTFTYAMLPALTANIIPSTNSSGFLESSSSVAETLLSSAFNRGLTISNVVSEMYVDSSTLTDNSSATAVTAFQFAAASFAGEEIAYVIENGASPSLTRVGTIRVVCQSDGSVPSLSDMYTETADCGVQWTATNSGGTISINYITTNQGSNRTMRADLKQFRR